MELSRGEAVRILEVIAKAHSFSLAQDYMDHSRKLVDPFLQTSRLTKELAEVEQLLMHRIGVNHPKEIKVLREEPKIVPLDALTPLGMQVEKKEPVTQEPEGEARRRGRPPSTDALHAGGGGIV